MDPHHQVSISIMTRVNRSLICLLILLLLTVNSSETILDVWQHACPFSDLCTAESLETNNQTADLTLQPCCSNCSCDEECWIFDNCCPDFKSPPVYLQKASCTDLKIVNDYTETFLPYHEYRVIDFCPRNFDVIDQQLVDQCAERYVDELNDVVAVSDIKNIIYKNKYCALCHGVSDVVSWNLRLIDCSESFYKTTIPASQRTQVILNQCKLYSVPSDDARKYETMLCGRSLRSSCMSTTKYSGLDLDRIQEMCLNGPYLPYQHVLFGTNIYLFKNVFCLLCEYGEVKRHMCPRPEDGLAKSQITGFSMLLGITNQPQEATTKTQHQCNETDIYDHTRGICRRVFCPPYNVVSYGQCLQLGGSFTNYGIKLRIQFQPLNSIFIQKDGFVYDDESSKTYAQSVLLEYGLNQCDVTSLSLEVFVEKKTNKLAFMGTNIFILFDDTCDAKFISHMVSTRLSERHDTSVVINNITINVSRQVTFNNQTFALFQKTAIYDKLMVFYFKFDNKIRFQILDTDFFLCPYFLLDIHQYNEFTTDVFRDGALRNLTEISELTQLKNGFYSLSYDSIAVCIDTYFEMYTKSKATTTMVDGPLLYGSGLFLFTFLVYAMIY